MQLSKNLTLAEIIRSESAKRNGLTNKPTPRHTENLKILATKVFQPIRDFFNRPVHVSSGYRSAELNKLVNGSTTSQHSTGEALDIDMDGTEVTNKEVFDYIKDNLEFDQLIWEFGTNDNPDWVHVSYRASGKQRKQVLKAIKVKGKTTYVHYN
jgi:hypothetical protein